MPEGSRLDSVFVGSNGFENLALPAEDIFYRPFADTSDNDCRLIQTHNPLGGATSRNAYVTVGGSISSRPPFGISSRVSVSVAASIPGRLIARQFSYKTLPSTAGVTYGYLLLSCQVTATGKYEMYYCTLPATDAGTVGNPVLFTNLRNINDSSAPHIMGSSRGLAYIKGFPTAGGLDKLASIIFDGSNGTPSYKPWGALGPTTPARITGWVGQLTAAVTDVATAWTVAAITAPPAAPFTLQCEFEQVTVTVVAGAGPYNLTVTRHVNGTTAFKHTIKTPVLYRDWTVSDHKVDVPQGWEYSYAYHSITDNITNRAIPESNPDFKPSNTGPFFDLKPKFTYDGLADTTNYPFIEMFRTTNGGGTMYALEKIANPGAGSQTYEDKSFASGAGSATHNDPVPDTKLNTANPAPSITSNSPPPTVNAPLVVGTDVPSFSTSNIENYQSRLWYAIDNVVYFSGDEEIKMGIPEECWPSGVAGNFIRFADKIVALRATNSNLYAIGVVNTYIINGTNKETFFARIISRDNPAWPSYTSSVSFENRVAFVTADRRVMVISGEVLECISDPIQSLTPLSSVGTDLYLSSYQLTYFKDRSKSWLCCLKPAFGSNNATMQVYDWGRSSTERRDFWFVPWDLKISSISGFSFGEQSQTTWLVGGAYTAGYGGALVEAVFPIDGVLSPGVTGEDARASAGGPIEQSFPVELYIATLKNPAGNHLNSKALPINTSVLTNVQLDYESSSTSLFPLVSVFIDSSYSTTPDVVGIPVDSTRRRAGDITLYGYTTKEYKFWQVGQCFRIFISSVGMGFGQWFIIDRIAVGFDPSAGPDSAGQTSNG